MIFSTEHPISVEEINPSSRVNYASKFNKKNNQQGKSGNNSKHHQNKNNNRGDNSSSNNVPENYVCKRCNAKAKHLFNQCPDKNSTCTYCNNKGHIERACRFAKFNSKFAGNSSKSHHLSAPEEDDPAQFFSMNTISEVEPKKTSTQTDINVKNSFQALADEECVNHASSDFKTAKQSNNPFLESGMFQYLKSQ